MEIGRGKRKILDLDKEKRVNKIRRLNQVMGTTGMYPLTAPGMPPPGPNFIRHAMALDEDSEIVVNNKTGEFTVTSTLTDLYKRALREPGFSLPVEVRPGITKTVKFVPGHIWGQGMAEWIESLSNPGVATVAVDGPHRSDVMIIGKMPWVDETKEGRNLISDTGEILINTCKQFGIRNLNTWYVTNLLKYMPPDGKTDIKSAWVKDCLPLLHQELRLVRPKYILFIGADSSKELLGAKYGVGYMEGRIVEYTFPVHPTAADPPEYRTALCMTVVHPAQVSREPSQAKSLQRGIGRWGSLLQGNRFDVQETGLDHRVCTSLEEAEEWTKEAAYDLLQEEPRRRILAVDAEWDGQHPVNKGAAIRTVQISWGEKKAICFKLRDTEQKVAFRDMEGKPALKRLGNLLTKFVNQYRVCGHFFVADLEHLVHEGFDFRAGFTVPLEPREDGTPAWQRCMEGEGGLDTASMAHALEETALLGLENLTIRHTQVPRYDIPLHDWKEAYCKMRGIKPGALEGYGACPDHILIPYANYDADGTRRVAISLMDLLDEDEQHHCCWEAFWETMLIQPVILEMHQTGMYANRAQIDEHTVNFLDARNAKEHEIIVESGWYDVDHPDDKEKHFNIRSVQQVKEYLFGEHLNGKLTKDGKIVRLRPEGAKSLKVMPLLDTSKPPKVWKKLVEEGKAHEHSPSTGKQVLAILAQDNLHVADQINQIRDYRFLDQVLKSVLRPPRTEKDGAWLYEDDVDGNEYMVYDAGLAHVIDDDGHVRCHMYPTAETGRWKHARPNLANISKTRDPDYERLLGKENYKHKLRSVLMAPPPGTMYPWVVFKNGKKCIEMRGDDPADELFLLESDLKGAELAVMAIYTGDAKMIDHVQRANSWPEDGYDINGNAVPDGKYPHPNYYDIHSNIAIMAFNLKCHPSKQGLKDIGKSHLRNIAKTVIFGIAYGRQAKAIALTAKEQKKTPKPGEEPEPDVTVEDAQRVIDSIFEMYAGLAAFFAECRKRALGDGWLCNAFGRFRRFPAVTDFKLEGEFERQAMNFPIQSTVASLVDRWLAYLHAAREQLLSVHGEYLFQWQLQIHDALVLRAPARHMTYIAKTLIPWALQQVPVYPSRLDGTILPNAKAYHLGADVEISKNWGEKFNKAKLAELGIAIK